MYPDVNSLANGREHSPSAKPEEHNGVSSLAGAGYPDVMGMRDHSPARPQSSNWPLQAPSAVPMTPEMRRAELAALVPFNIPRVDPADVDLDEIRTRISLHRLMLDVYEYHGMNLLLWALVFFVVGVLGLYSLWGGIYSNSAAFSSSVTQSMTTALCGPGQQLQTNQQPAFVSQIGSMGQAVDFMTAYIVCSVQQTKAMALSNATELRVSQWARVPYMRMLTVTSSQFIGFNGSNYEVSMQPSSFWSPSPTCSGGQPSGAVSSSQYVTALLAGRTGGEYTDICQAQTQAQIMDWTGNVQNLQSSTIDTPVPPGEAPSNCPGGSLNASFYTPGDRAWIAQSAETLRLQVLAENIVGSEYAAQTYRIYVTLTVQYSVYVNNKIVKRVATAQLPPESMPSGTLAWMVIFLLLTLYHTTTDAITFHRAWTQSRTVTTYFLYIWNWVVIISQGCNWVWVLWFFVGMGTYSSRLKDIYPPSNDCQMQEVQQIADNYSSFMYFGTIVVAFLGIRICRFMRVHVGLFSLYRVFVDVFNNALDFIIFAIYLMLVLGVITFASFQISGGNPLFINFPDGVSAIARLTFGFLDYEAFYNSAIGLNPNYTWSRSVIFWVSVVLLNIYVTNTLIAMFNNAFSRTQDNVLRIEHSFIVLIIYRFFFFFYYYLCLLPRTLFGSAPPPPSDAMRRHSRNSLSGLPAETVGGAATVPAPAPTWFTRFKERRFMVHRRIINRYHHPPNDPVDQHTFWVLMARWSVVSLVDMRALAALYLEYASLRLRPHPPQWHTLTSWQLNGGPAKQHPELEAEITEPQLESLITTARRLDDNLSMHVWGIGLFRTSPFSGLDPSTRELLRTAIMEVYVHVPKPIIDANDNGIDDQLESTKSAVDKLRKRLENMHELQQQKSDEVESEMDALRALVQTLESKVAMLTSLLTQLSPP